MMRMNLTSIDAAGLGVIGVLSAGVYFGVVTPSSQREAEITQDRERLAEVDQSLLKAEAQRREIDAQIARYDGIIKERNVTLLPVGSLNERIAAITHLSGQSKVEISELQAGNPTSLGAVLGVPVQLAGVGEYASISGFIKELHAQFPDVAVQSLELTGSPTDPSTTPMFRASLLWRAAGAVSNGSAGAGSR